MSHFARKTAVRWLAGVAGGTLLAPAVHAVQIDLDYGDGITGTLNTSITLGAAIRMQQRSNDLLGKGNLYPQLCGERTLDNGGGTHNFNSCQGINANDVVPAQSLAGIPGDLGEERGVPTGIDMDDLGSTGVFSINGDNGNWNYDQYDLIQAPLKITQDLGLSYNDYGFFGRWLYFYDFVNNDFEEYKRNIVLADTQPSGPPGTDGQPTWGAGEEAFVPRSDPELLRQIGSDLQLLDAYVYGFLPFIGDRELVLKVGRQTISWGESTLLVINSVNQANPVNANNLFRTGFTPEEVFTPVGMVYASTGITENLSLETYYQYEWDPIEAPTPGSFFSGVDIGTNYGVRDVSISFGGPADDPLRRGTPLNNPLAGLTDSTTNLFLRPDNEARDDGQYGVSFKYYAEDFNNGTDFGFYYMNYHSKLPYASFYGSDLSCARTHPDDATFSNNPGSGEDAATGAANGTDAYSLLSLVASCPNLPLAENIGSDPGAIFGAPGSIPLGDFLDALEDAGLPGGVIPGTGPVTDAVPLDTVQLQLEYPEDIKLFGMSFNTTLGDLSLQGEVAYRPNLPVQVDAEDLTFAALGPTLTSCHRVLNPEQFGGGYTACGDTSDPQANLSQSGVNTFNLIPPEDTGEPGDGGDGPSVQRAYPSFITSYRGQTVGETIPNGYIRGFERVAAVEYNLGATYILGATDNPIGADQVIFLFETGANQILNMPESWQYQIDAPSTWRHASAGVVDQNALGVPADGIQSASYEVTTADGETEVRAWNDLDSAQQRAVLERVRHDAPGCYPGVCRGINTNADADNVYIGDGLRFNPQQETNSYATAFSWGYRVIAIVRYESILPGISVQPFIIWQHDINGIMPGPGENFVEGRKNLLVNIETRYKSAWSFNLGGGWWTGGGPQNVLRDRDLLQFYVRYQF